MVEVNVRLCEEGYAAVGVDMPGREVIKQITSIGLTDSGAQATCAGLRLVRNLGYSVSDLIPVSLGLETATVSAITILGALLVEISARDSLGNVWTTKQLCYICRGLTSLFLSQDACGDLGIIPRDFPTIGSCRKPGVGTVQAGVGHSVDGAPEDVTHTLEEGSCRPDEEGRCSCPIRQPPPDQPELPCKATPENRERLEQFIRSTYATSVFNQCETQKLPHMSGPELKIFLKPDARPYAIHKAIPVPLHWQEEVKRGLDRDVRLGVIEKVGPNVPTEWCCRMVCVPKKKGRPRRTVDLQPLNRVTMRQTHQTSSPFHLEHSRQSWTCGTLTTRSRSGRRIER